MRAPTRTRNNFLILLLFLTFLLFIQLYGLLSIANAVDYIGANQLAIAWSPSTGVQAPQVPEYTVYIKSAAGGDPIKVGATEQTQMTVLFSEENIWFFGVSTKKYQLIDDPDNPGTPVKIYSGESAIAWSDVPASCQDGKTFAGVYLKIPTNIGGMKPNP